MPTIIPTAGTQIFNSHSSELKIYTPTVTTNAYKTAKNWSEYADIIEPYNFLYGGYLQITDPQLKSYLLNNYDDDGDYEISLAESENITMINCSGQGISSLAGLEACANLVSINCSNNNITTIELPYLEKLTTLVCYNNPINRLNLSNCFALNKLNIIDSTTNAIVNDEIRIDGYAGATTMDFTIVGTPFTTFSFTNATALTEIRFYGDFTTVNLYGNSSLENIDVTPIANLQKLDVHSCNLLTIDVAQKSELKYLDASANKLTKVNVAQNPLLEYLNVASNSLSAINVRNNTALKSLHISNNTSINTLEIAKNIALTELYANNLSVTELNVSNNTMLTKLECHTNGNLTTLLCSNDFAINSNRIIVIDFQLNIINANGEKQPLLVGDLVNCGVYVGAVCEASIEQTKVVSHTKTEDNRKPTKEELLVVYSYIQLINERLGQYKETVFQADWYWSTTKGDTFGDYNNYYVVHLGTGESTDDSGYGERVTSARYCYIQDL